MNIDVFLLLNFIQHGQKRPLILMQHCVFTHNGNKSVRCRLPNIEVGFLSQGSWCSFVVNRRVTGKSVSPGTLILTVNYYSANEMYLSINKGR
jgi:hypothetical protein